MNDAKTKNEILNPGLYRLHRIFFIAFISFGVIMALIGVRIAIDGGEDAAIGFLPIATAHWFAARGVKDGTLSGKVISRVIG